MGLRIYTVHMPTSSLRKAMTQALPQLIKEGFSWPALFLGVIWALWHRLWIEAAALIALFLAVGVILEFLEPGQAIQSAVMIAIAVLIGASGNNWRRESLRRRGFIDAGVVAGPDSETALCRYLDLRAMEARRDSPASRETFAPAAMVAPPAVDGFTPDEAEEPPAPRGDFSVEPAFGLRQASNRPADESDDAQPDQPRGGPSPGRAAPGSGYGG